MPENRAEVLYYRKDRALQKRYPKISINRQSSLSLDSILQLYTKLAKILQTLLYVRVLMQFQMSHCLVVFFNKGAMDKNK